MHWARHGGRGVRPESGLLIIHVPTPFGTGLPGPDSRPSRRLPARQSCVEGM